MHPHEYKKCARKETFAENIRSQSYGLPILVWGHARKEKCIKDLLIEVWFCPNGCGYELV